MGSLPFFLDHHKLGVAQANVEVHGHTDAIKDGEAIIEFLSLLLDQFSGKILIVWDGASVHKAKKLREFLIRDLRAKRLYLVIQPPYAPQLNADEQVWAYLKHVRMKNECFLNLNQLQNRLVSELEQLVDRPALIKQFFKPTSLRAARAALS